MTGAGRRAQPKTGRAQGRAVRVREPKPSCPTSLSEELRQLASSIGSLAAARTSRRKQIELEAAADRCEALADAAGVARAEAAGPGLLDRRAAGTRRKLDLASAPIEVGPPASEAPYDSVPTVILTSATLSVGGRTASATSSERLGLPTIRRCSSAARSTTASRPSCTCSASMPDPSRDAAGFEEACLAKIQEYVLRTQGRAFVLFTSYQTMQRAADAPADWSRDAGLDAALPGRRPAANQMVETVPRDAGAPCCSASIASGRAWTCRARRCRT